MLENSDDLSMGCARSFKSSKNKPLLVRFNGKLLPSLVACNMCCEVSMVAPRALSKVFDSKNGVDPGWNHCDFEQQSWQWHYDSLLALQHTMVPKPKRYNTWTTFDLTPNVLIQPI